MTAQLGTIIPHSIPEDHCRQATALSMLQEAADKYKLNEMSSGKILDLGCGSGNSYESLKRTLPVFSYFGVDIEASPEVASRERDDLSFDTFDGVNLPYDEDSMDVIFCCQVLEHVRHPEELLQNIKRVLRPSGIFVGSVSFLEPYHSFSIFNWSPYGVVTLFEDNGLKDVTLRPGIDGIALTWRNIFGHKAFRGSFNSDSIFNYFLEKLEENGRRTPQQINAQKLAVAGHICFYATA
ncbi:methyltransferase domain-containing protein [Erythrobacter sp. SCSIO 43205]|uniref:class I SAM-dependent methyltransferase n=1 Tax=Erythrobacter sp. SCSIO 43205 TaxID=2779361 RepID=UPI001CA9D03B|nr:class I SAM-dependent methyltransferase [Erythrobacter sp. SCSIO 43205]UAB77828.1 methyltransferase domain-containing protein [Erythrobacter sp. SCSIO 43205]